MATAGHRRRQHDAPETRFGAEPPPAPPACRQPRYPTLGPQERTEDGMEMAWRDDEEMTRSSRLPLRRGTQRKGALRDSRHRERKSRTAVEIVMIVDHHRF